MTGVESVLAAMLVVVWFAAWIRVWRTGEHAATRGLVGLGLLAGVAFLARMDSAIVVAPACLAIAFRTRRAPRRLAAFVVAGAVLPVAWIGAMLLLTGDFVPTSGAALRVLSEAGDGLDVSLETTLRRLAFFSHGLLAFLDDDPRHLPGTAP